MKTYYGNYLGMVINGGQNDPEKRGRCQVFIPHIMPALYEGWNKEGFEEFGGSRNISIIGDNLLEQGALSMQEVEKLRTILPWAECAAPIVGAGPSAAMSSDGQMHESLRNTGNLPDARGTIGGLGYVAPLGTTGSTGDAVATISPKDNGSSGAHLDVRWKPGTKGSTDIPPLDLVGKYIQVGGIPANQLRITDGPNRDGSSTAGSKNFGSGRSIERHPAWDLAFKDSGTIAGAPVTITGGARVIAANQGVSAGSRGPASDYADIETPEGTLRLYHLTTGSVRVGAGSTASSTPPLVNPSGVDGLSDANTEQPTDNESGQINGGVFSSKLAEDRSSYFGQELQDPRIINALWERANNEVGSNPAQQQAWIETVANRAYFSNRSLESVVQTEFIPGGYYPSSSFKNFGSAPSNFQNVVNNVFQKGSNITNMATDNASNQRSSAGGNVALNRINAGSTGTWYENGQPVSPERAAELNNTNPTPNGVQYLYRADARGTDYDTTAGLAAARYAEENNIQVTAAANAPMIANPAYRGSADGSLQAFGSSFGPDTNNLGSGMFGYAREGQFVWCFFQEGDPHFPVYFAASYGQKEWNNAMQRMSPGNGEPGQHGTLIKFDSGGMRDVMSEGGRNQSGLPTDFAFEIFGQFGHNLRFGTDTVELNSLYNYRQQTEGDHHDITLQNRETRTMGDDNHVVGQDCFVTIGNWNTSAQEAAARLQETINQAMEIT